jgi:hypothetical protein
VSNPGENYTDANTDPADRPREPQHQAAWSVIAGFLERLADTEPAVSVESATADLIAALRATGLLNGDAMANRLAAAEQAAWALGKVPDHGSPENAAARMAYGQWRALIPEEAHVALSQTMSGGRWQALVQQSQAARQRMFDQAVRAIPGPHQAQLGPLEDVAAGTEPPGDEPR